MLKMVSLDFTDCISMDHFLNAHTLLYSEAAFLMFVVILHLLPYILCASSEGPGENALRVCAVRLAIAL